MRLVGWLRRIFGGGAVPQGVVWLTRDAMWTGVLADVAGARRDGSAVVLVAHFRDTLEELYRRLEAAGVPVRASAGTLDAGRLGGGDDAEIPLVRSDALAFAGRAPDGRPDGWLRVVVVERYPLRSREDAIERAAAAVPGARVVYHCSLDDELLQAFASDKLRDLMTRLGQRPDESISHPMIERAVRNAQAQLGKTGAAQDASADSVRQWFAVNRPRRG
jgi:preprotein translocase subunit SecA